jgi:hypothetical protein
VDTIEKFMTEHDALHDLLAELPNKTSHQIMVPSPPSTTPTSTTNPRRRMASGKPHGPRSATALIRYGAQNAMVSPVAAGSVSSHSPCWLHACTLVQSHRHPTGHSISSSSNSPKTEAQLGLRCLVHHGHCPRETDMAGGDTRSTAYFRSAWCSLTRC